MKKEEMLELFYVSDRNLLLRAMVDEIYKRPRGTWVIKELKEIKDQLEELKRNE